MSKKTPKAPARPAADKVDAEGITVTLTVAEIVAVAQRALTEKLSFDPHGVFSGLWERIDQQLSSQS